MNVKHAFFLACASATLAFASGCASSPDTSYAATPPVADDPDRMVCKREQDTGSRLAKRVCKTAREWEQERFENQDALRNATRSGMPPKGIQQPTPMGGG